MSRRYVRRDRTEEREVLKKRDSRISNGVSLAIGCSLVAATLGLCVVGTNQAISSMQRQMDEVLAQAAQSVADMDTSSQLDNSSSDNTIVPSDDKWTSEQIEWMRKHHVTYYNGKPYDEFGHVIDDPTTAENEAESGNFKDTVPTDNSGSEKSDKSDKNTEIKGEKSDGKSKKEPETSPAWYEGNDEIGLTDKGKPYYIVKSGDCLSKIAKMSGFTEDELVARNGIKNKNLIYVGDKIYFPDQAQSSDVDLQKGLG